MSEIDDAKRIGKRLTDPTFRYTNAVSTDIRKTFARVRREQRQADDLECARVEQEERERHANVAPLRKGKV